MFSTVVLLTRHVCSVIIKIKTLAIAEKKRGEGEMKVTAEEKKAIELVYNARLEELFTAQGEYQAKREAFEAAEKLRALFEVE